MRGWSIGVGRIFGVELRLGFYLLILLPALMTYSIAGSERAGRGILLWLLLLAAIAVREIGRGLASAYFGRQTQRLVLLPTGALPSRAEDTGKAAKGDRTVALAGPLANFAVGVSMSLLMYAVTASVNLFERPWVTPSHLLRSAIWAQILLGGINLLPAFPLDAGLLLRKQFMLVRGAASGAKAAISVSQATGLLLILAGIGLQNVWMIFMGGSVLLAAQSEAYTARAQHAAASVTIAEVMLGSFSTLSASDTLEDALSSSVHSLQDAFPVLRGQVVVGTVARSAIADALRSDGNGYVQSVMSRRLAVCAPADMLVTTLRQPHIADDTGLIAVVESERVIGIVSTHTLSQSMAFLGQSRRLLRRNGGSPDSKASTRSDRDDRPSR